MKPAIKKRWLAALRSGQYKQTREVLTNGKGFCCLGVLCNLHAIEHGKEWRQTADGVVYLNMAEPDEVSVRVLKWAGLPLMTPQLPDGRDLGEINDSGTNFRRIADLIEKFL